MTETSTAPPADDRPLFIVGCVRSGTTLTRDLLRRVTSFICPEETHFFRWAEPFRTPSSWAPYRNNAVLKKHRQLDGISEKAFQRILMGSHTKAELQQRYITAYARHLGITGLYRWFDKSPQNIYGAPLIAHELPKATFLHLVRNPLNVVASLKSGRCVKVADLHGACNYWVEAVHFAMTLKAAFPHRVLQMRYEDLVDDVPKAIDSILSLSDIPAVEGLFTKSDARPERNLWLNDLTEADLVARLCGKPARAMGYNIGQQVKTACRGRAI